MTVITDVVVVEAFRLDQLDPSSPRLLVGDEARELKAHLIVRTAMEIHDPARYVPNMTHWQRDVFRLAGWYAVPPLKVADVVKAAADRLVAVWRSEAQA